MILGLDVSTSITGICVIDNDGLFVESSYVDCRKIKEFTDKCFSVSQHLDGLLYRDIDYIFVEDKLSGFSGGKTMQQTLMKLAAINGAITYIAHYHFGSVPSHIHPSTAKATMKRDGLIIPRGGDKKRLTLDFVRGVIPNFPYEETRNGNPQPYCYDMADAYCIARAGYLKHVCVKREN